MKYYLIVFYVTVFFKNVANHQSSRGPTHQRGPISKHFAFATKGVLYEKAFSSRLSREAPSCVYRGHNMASYKQLKLNILSVGV